MNPWDIPYRIVSEKIQPEILLSTMRKYDGSYTTSLNEMVDLLSKKLLPDDALEEEGEVFVEQRRLAAIPLDYLGNIEEEEMLVINEDMQQVNVGLKFDKTPGPNGLKSENFKQDPKSYRPICLSNILEKIFENLILTRIQDKKEVQCNMGSERVARRRMSSIDYVI